MKFVVTTDNDITELDVTSVSEAIKFFRENSVYLNNDRISKKQYLCIVVAVSTQKHRVVHYSPETFEVLDDFKKEEN